MITSYDYVNDDVVTMFCRIREGNHKIVTFTLKKLIYDFIYLYSYVINYKLN